MTHHGEHRARYVFVFDRTVDGSVSVLQTGSVESHALGAYTLQCLCRSNNGGAEHRDKKHYFFHVSIYYIDEPRAAQRPSDKPVFTRKKHLLYK